MHAKAVYVPSLMQFPPPECSYGAVSISARALTSLASGGSFSRKRVLRSRHQDRGSRDGKARYQAPETVSSQAQCLNIFLLKYGQRQLMRTTKMTEKLTDTGSGRPGFWLGAYYQ